MTVKIGTIIGALGLGGLAVFIGQMDAVALPGGGNDGGVAAGPDVIVGALPNISAFGQGVWPVTGGTTYVAYSVGTTSCNIGNQQLLWNPNPAVTHPVMPQGIYRVKNGVMQQVGQSWVKHGFCALQETLCGACTPAGSGCPTVLGIGCSDPYSSSLNGSQTDLKSRYGINAATGVYSGSYANPAIPSGYPTNIRCRIHVPKNDLDPILNTGAKYVIEGMYIQPQDAASGNSANNGSYRTFDNFIIAGFFTGTPSIPVQHTIVSVGTTNFMAIGASQNVVGTVFNCTGPGSGTGTASRYSISTGYPLTLTGTTTQMTPAIYYWQTQHTDVATRGYDVAGDGRFIVASRAFLNANGTYHYAYAVANFNSDRNGSYFSVPVDSSVTVTNITAVSPFNHSGDTASNDPWTSTNTGGVLTWSCPAAASESVAHSIRWGTMHTFEFDANTAPTTSASSGLTVGIYKAATTASPATSIAVLGYKPTPFTPPCAPSDLNCDGSVNGLDLAAFLACWGTTTCGDTNSDGRADGNDLANILAGWTP
jgi:hypothetical protein